jgi:AraC-like DNA-binding protein
VVGSAGYLNPGDAEVRFARTVLGADLDALVRHVWTAHWDVPPGEVRAQRVLTYPSANVVVQPGRADLHGPDRVLSVQGLTGRSWVVGVLLRPAATRLLTATDPVRLVGAHEPLPTAPLPALTAAMTGTRSGAGASATTAPADRPEHLAEVAAALRAWLAPVAAGVDDAGLLANAACRVAEERTDVLRAADLADAVGTTPRTLSRVVRAHTGLTPKWLIECRRLQAAAGALHADPDADLAALAADLGYTDQAHFTRRYRRVIGETPGATRRRARPPAPAGP